MKGSKLTRGQVIRALRRLERGWPDDLWIFVASGEVSLMQRGENGECVTVKRFYQGQEGDAVDPEKKIAAFPRIPADGGDW